jgi:hypothetical protein
MYRPEPRDGFPEDVQREYEEDWAEFEEYLDSVETELILLEPLDN